MGINLLFHNSQLVSDSNEFMKENFKRYFFGRQCWVTRMQDHLSLVPTNTEAIYNHIGVLVSQTGKNCFN